MESLVGCIYIKRDKIYMLLYNISSHSKRATFIRERISNRTLSYTICTVICSIFCYNTIFCIYRIIKRIYARESIISCCRYAASSATACRANYNLLIIFTCVNGDILTSQQRYMDFISPVVCNNSSVSTVIGHTIHVSILRNVRNIGSKCKGP